MVSFQLNYVLSWHHAGNIQCCFRKTGQLLSHLPVRCEEIVASHLKLYYILQLFYYCHAIGFSCHVIAMWRTYARPQHCCCKLACNDAMGCDGLAMHLYTLCTYDDHVMQWKPIKLKASHYGNVMVYQLARLAKEALYLSWSIYIGMLVTVH